MVSIKQKNGRTWVNDKEVDPKDPDVIAKLRQRGIKLGPGGISSSINIGSINQGDGKSPFGKNFPFGENSPFDDDEDDEDVDESTQIGSDTYPLFESTPIEAKCPHMNREYQGSSAKDSESQEDANPLGRFGHLLEEALGDNPEVKEVVESLKGIADEVKDSGLIDEIKGEIEGAFEGKGPEKPKRPKRSSDDIPYKDIFNKTGKSIQSKPIKETIAKSITLTQKPEVHPLATIEASLNQLQAYCNLCETQTNARDLEHKDRMNNQPVPVKNGWFKSGPEPEPYQPSTSFPTSQQEKAIDAASKVIEGDENYDKNKPESDSKLLAYVRLVRPVLEPILRPFIPKLQKYKDGSNVKALLEDFVDADGEETKAEIAEVLAEELNLEPENVPLLLQTVLSAVAKDEDGLKSYSLEKAANAILPVLAEFEDVEGLAKSIRQAAKDAKTYQSKPRITADMSAFMLGCSGQCGYTSDCKKHRENLEAAFKKLEVYDQTLKIPGGDLISAVSLALDATAGVLETMPNGDFENLKSAAIMYVMQELAK